ncbi:MAG: deoxyribodipyrimidine photo-lyase [Saprospiraceae bacterium]|nr:deoxyribodipyrimidine photo-lyase [Saprospiraceae bacterium]
MNYSIFWFRRDLRLSDNAGLYHALKSGFPVKSIFIFDVNILNKLEDKADPRVSFIYDSLMDLKTSLKKLGSDLEIYYGDPISVWKELAADSQLKSVFCNRDYEQYAIQRDDSVRDILNARSIEFKTFKDQVIFEKNEVLKDDGNPYVVFTPYKRRWLAKLDSKLDKENQDTSYFFKSYPCAKYESGYLKFEANNELTLEKMGFEKTTKEIPSTLVARSVIKQYNEHRDFPALKGTSRLGIHFRFGTISIREKARNAQKLNATYLSELIWRDFYSMILQHFPRVEDQPFREKYRQIEWRNNEEEFDLWCKGQTGYPIVDAGMRELNATGFMHNRVRMITASFLTKHLLIDWKWGERYFAEKLLDYDLASNSGGWQWAAGCGTDAAPYFRIFNPYTQADKFDKKRVYIKKWVPELESSSYPEPVVDHKMARERCLATYKHALN